MRQLPDNNKNAPNSVNPLTNGEGERRVRRTASEQQPAKPTVSPAANPSANRNVQPTANRNVQPTANRTVQPAVKPTQARYPLANNAGIYIGHNPYFDVGYFLTSLCQILVALGALALAGYFVYHLVNGFSSTMTTTTAYAVTESEYRNATAYIIRGEETLHDTTGGALSYSVADGERVAKGDLIAELYPSSSRSAIDTVSVIDREIALLVKSGTLVGSGGIPGVTGEVRREYNLLMQLLADRNYPEAAASSDALRISLAGLAILDGSAGDDGYGKRIAELRAERASYVSSLGNAIGSLIADYPAYYFRDCDGYEDVFTLSLIENFNLENFGAALAASPSDISGCCGKLITDPKWYIAVPTTAEELGGCHIDESYNVTFTDNYGIVCRMTLEKYVTGENGELLLLFSTSDMPQGFEYLRRQDIKIEYRVYNGYRVPLGAVRSYEGMTGVFIMHGDYVYFRKINLLYEGNGYCIVSKYSDIEPGAPLTYRVLGFDMDGALGDYASLHMAAEARGWTKRVYDNGGIPVKYGDTYLYYYYLNDLEDIILTGKDLSDGKVVG